MVAFSSTPSNQRVPLVSVEFDSSQAQQGPSLLAYQGLLVGQKTSAGTWVADTVQRCSSVAQAILGGGRGSMIHRMAIAWFAINKSTPLWFGVLADNGAGVAATGTIVVTGPATAAGTIPLWLGGVLVNVGVNLGDASTDIATAIGAAVNANLDLPVIATVNASTVTLAFRHKGLTGNTYDVRNKFRDTDALPAGVGLTITAMGGVVAGTTAPVLTNLVAAIADMWFQIWGHPYTDATSLSAIEAELAARFLPNRQQDALSIASMSGTLSAHTTLGASRNSPSSCIQAQPGDAPLTPPMEIAAETAALAALYGQQDPARPFNTLAYANAVCPPEGDQFSSDERNVMLFTGIATTKRGPGGVMQMERLITTYQTSPAGAPDIAYLDATTLLTLMYLRYSLRVRFATKYPRHKLADDGTQFAAGQPIMTPKLATAETVLWAREMEGLGLIEDIDSFKRDLLVVRSVSDRNRLDMLVPPTLVAGLDVLAILMQPRL